jgi:hypothetical protein
MSDERFTNEPQDPEAAWEWRTRSQRARRYATPVASVVALHEGYRGLMIGRTARLGPKAGPDDFIGAISCDCTCHAEVWRDGEREIHKPDCMARPDYLVEAPLNDEAPR